MPVLKKYSDSYNKEGYYVHAPIDSVQHPIPLQTPDVTARIYRKLGYEAGDHVPNELTWKMYSANLHWTENKGAEQHTEDEVKEAILDKKGLSLTDEQRDAIVSIVESYNGRFENELSSLASEFDEEAVSEGTTEPHSTENSGNKQYFGIEFKNIDNQHHLDNLRTLEEYGCIYGRFAIGDKGEFRLCRVKFTPKEINDYVDSLAALDEFQGYQKQGYSQEESINRIPNKQVKKRIKEFSSVANPMFITPHLETLICGGKPNRYEFVPKSKTGD